MKRKKEKNKKEKNKTVTCPQPNQVNIPFPLDFRHGRPPSTFVRSGLTRD